MKEQGGSQVSVHINGIKVSVEEGTTLLQAASSAGIEIPTLCWAENLTPANACRLCVVEQQGSRTLVSSCSRVCEDGAQILTDTDRVHRSRKMVLEFLASSNDLSQSPDLVAWLEMYGADTERYQTPAKIDDQIKIEDDLFIRAYDRCVLCYKCVEACGDDAQHTFAIAIAGRGFDARVSTEYEVALPESACVYCGTCVGVCPTNALQFKTEFDLRDASDWRPSEQKVTETVCSYCGVGCSLELHTQDNQIVKVTSPSDNSVTSGHLCIKGRFGWQYVNAPEFKSKEAP